MGEMHAEVSVMLPAAIRLRQQGHAVESRPAIPLAGTGRAAPPSIGHLLNLLDVQRKFLKEKVQDSNSVIVDCLAKDSPSKVLRAKQTRTVAKAMMKQGVARRNALLDKLQALREQKLASFTQEHKENMQESGQTCAQEKGHSHVQTQKQTLTESSHVAQTKHNILQEQGQMLAGHIPSSDVGKGRISNLQKPLETGGKKEHEQCVKNVKDNCAPKQQQFPQKSGKPVQKQGQSAQKRGQSVQKQKPFVQEQGHAGNKHFNTRRENVEYKCEREGQGKKRGGAEGIQHVGSRRNPVHQRVTPPRRDIGS